MFFRTAALIVSATIATTACQDGSTAPHALSVKTTGVTDRSTADTHYDLDLILHPIVPGDGSGHVRFRQAEDGDITMQRIDLGVTVRHLAPNTDYVLQRAVDTNLDGVCTGTGSNPWLTLGAGLVAQSIRTDDEGDAYQDLFRVVKNAPGTKFDIYMRIIRKDDVSNTSAQPVLISRCYEYAVR